MRDHLRSIQQLDLAVIKNDADTIRQILYMKPSLLLSFDYRHLINNRLFPLLLKIINQPFSTTYKGYIAADIYFLLQQQGLT